MSTGHSLPKLQGGWSIPADYQFPLEVSDQVGHYTEVSTVDTDAQDSISVSVGTDTVESVAVDTVAVGGGCASSV